MTSSGPPQDSGPEHLGGAGKTIVLLALAALCGALYGQFVAKNWIGPASLGVAVLALAVLPRFVPSRTRQIVEALENERRAKGSWYDVQSFHLWSAIAAGLVMTFFALRAPPSAERLFVFAMGIGIVALGAVVLLKKLKQRHDG